MVLLLLPSPISCECYFRSSDPPPNACDSNTYSTPGLATNCTTCPDTTEPTQDKGACKCVAGTVTKAGTAWEQGTLVCEDCPAGYFVSTGASWCSACSGYYEYSTAGATTCATCPIDSYANAEHTGCQCNAGCTPQGSGLTLRCSCPVSFALFGAGLISSSGGSCSDLNSGLEGQGSICQCKAGLRQSGTFDLDTSSTLACAGPPSYDDAAGISGCSNNNAYALPCFTACRTCSTGCKCTVLESSILVDGNSRLRYRCTTGGIGVQAYCNCSLEAVGPGRHLHSANLHNTSVPIAPEALDMETLITTSTQQQFNEHLVEASDQTHNQDNQQPQFTLAPTHIIPTLKLDGKPATVLPMEVLRTTWEGRDATDVATCLSGALLTTSNVSLLAPPSVLAGLGLQQAAAVSLSAQLLPQFWPEHGGASVFTSSMYKGGPRLSARELKAALVKHYTSLLTLPSCMRAPKAVAHRLRVAQSNIVGMTTRSSTLRGGDLPDTHDDMLTTMELAVEVAHVKNEEYPELCAGLDGNSFRLRFAGFGGESSLPAASPNHIWVYVAVAEDVELCGATE
uniref:Tyrosine-protein kinase ephrin type A/B receptor-like domain-containing protein n=1 Tax=Tetradesmus obliquus TaxID=3088 RepID=A0A383VAK6_TETOB|eukprot:jgi/Sobl393_1/6779/SZX62231.1